jgi:glutathione S-transferase
VGDALTLADACLVPQLYHARRFGVGLDNFETLLRVERECSQLDAFARAHAESQPDAPRPAPAL